jgi:hypothetical protein
MAKSPAGAAATRPLAPDFDEVVVGVVVAWPESVVGAVVIVPLVLVLVVEFDEGAGVDEVDDDVVDGLGVCETRPPGTL